MAYRNEKIEISLTPVDKTTKDPITGMYVTMGFSPLRGSGLVAMTPSGELKPLLATRISEEHGYEIPVEYSLPLFGFERIITTPLFLTAGNYKILRGQNVVIASAQNGNVDINLGLPKSRHGEIVFIKRSDNTAGTGVIIRSTEGRTVSYIDDRFMTVTLGAYQAIILYSDGNVWRIMAHYSG